MGLDFVRRAAPSFVKAWNRSKRTLAEPTLFTRYPECRERTVIADLTQRTGLTKGAKVIVGVKASKLIVLAGNVQIGIIQEPPSDLHKAIHDAGDYALGQINRINTLSGTADVEIE